MDDSAARPEPTLEPDARTAFLHALSHELRTPLTSLIGFSALLSDRFSADLPPQAVELAGRIRHSAAKLERILSDLLDLDRLNRGELESRPSEVHLGELLPRLVGAVAHEGPSVTIEVEPADAGVSADPGLLERMVEILLLNSARRTGSEGTVTLRVSQTDAGLLLSVDDSGAPISPEVRPHVFETFRSHPVGPGGGSGVSLALVAGIAGLHGGHAWVADGPDGTTSFRVLLAT